jgi:heterodisulfide reductase subunit B
MNGDLLAQEMLAAIGGKVDKKRRQAFEKMCKVIVKHIQTNGVVTVVTTCPAGPGTGAGSIVTSTGIK